MTTSLKSEWRLLIAVVLFLAAFVVHADARDGGFVYDDHRFIEFNPALRAVDVASYFTDPVTASNPQGIQADIYRPVRTTLFALEYAWFGLSPRGWHTVSIVLHALNVVLCFLLLCALFGRTLPAACGAALFAVHPVTSESVAWVSSQGDLLAVTGSLACLLCFLRGGWPWTIAGLVAFAVAILSKESALVLPALVLLVAWIRPPARDPMTASLWRRPGTTTFWRLALMGGVLIAYFLVRDRVMAGVWAQVPHPEGSRWASVRGLLDAIVTYAGHLFVPRGFSFDTHTVVPARFGDPRVVLGAGFLLSTLLAGGFALRTRRYVLAFACLGFLVTLLPVSNVIVPLKTFVADRFLYPGLLCVAAGVGLAVRWMTAGFSARGLRFAGAWGALAALVIVCAVFANTASTRNQAWASDVSLWSAVRTDRPTNPNAYYGLAFDHARAHRLSEAERAFRTYLAFNPVDGKATAQLAEVFGEVARTLTVAPSMRAQMHAQSNVDENRTQALVLQLRLYRRAFDIWRLHGLVRGRGSPELLDHVLRRWMEAAVMLGDLSEARFACDRRFERAGLDPRGDLSQAPWELRLHRLYLAQVALERPVDRLPQVHQARATATREAVLVDVGLDPRQSNQALLAPWEAKMAALVNEADRTGRAVPVDTFLHRARVLLTLGHTQDALGLLQEAQRRFPGHPVVTAALQRLAEGGQ